MSALGIYGMSGGFGGGRAPGMKEGGLAYAEGGDIKTMSTEELQALLESPNLSPMEVALIEKQLMIRRRMEMNPETDQIMSPAMRAGVGSISTGDMVPEQMAGGGIVAFSQGGKPSGIDAIKDSSKARQSYREQLERETLDYLKRASTEDPFKESRAQEETIRAQIAESKRMSPYEALTMAGLRTMAGTSQYALANLGAGGEEGVKTLSRSKREESDLQKRLLDQGVEREKSKFGRDTQLQASRQTALGQLYGQEADIQRAEMNKKNLAQNAGMQNTLAAQRVFDNALKAEKTNLFQQNKARFNMDYTSAELEAEATANVMKRMTPAVRNLLFPEGMIAPAAPAVPVPGAGAAAAPATQKPKKITTIEERDKLPKGTLYIDPNGVTRTKS
jgi:hypothetical protein